MYLMPGYKEQSEVLEKVLVSTPCVQGYPSTPAVARAPLTTPLPQPQASVHYDPSTALHISRFIFQFGFQTGQKESTVESAGECRSWVTSTFKALDTLLWEFKQAGFLNQYFSHKRLPFLLSIRKIKYTKKNVLSQQTKPLKSVIARVGLFASPSLSIYIPDFTFLHLASYASSVSFLRFE